MTLVSPRELSYSAVPALYNRKFGAIDLLMRFIFFTTLFISTHLWGTSAFHRMCTENQNFVDQILNSQSQSKLLKSKRSKVTDPEKAKILLLFAEVKSLAKEVLKEKQSRTTEEYYQKLIEKIEQSHIVFDEEITDHNIFTKSDNSIHLGGLTSIVNLEPHSIFFLLAHEMGHIVGPTYFFHKSFLFNKTPQIEKYNAYYPFHDALVCVAQKVHSADLECLIDSTQSLSPIFYSPLIDNILQTVNGLKENPYVSVLFFKAGQRGCQIGQSEESFADFFAAEVIYQKYKSQNSSYLTIKASRFFYRYFAFMCVQDKVESILGYNQTSTYLPIADRINKIVFSHKELKKIFRLRSDESECSF